MRKRKAIKKVLPFALIVMVLFALLALGVSADDDCSHNWEVTEEEEPWCEYQGYIMYECTECGDRMEETLDALEHSYEVTEDVESTCSEKGHTTYTCEICGDTYTRTYVATGDHEWEFSHYEEEPLCEYSGVAVYECSECGDTKTETVEALGHSYEETESVEATCSEIGHTTYTCETCGDTYTNTYAATGAHDWPADRSGVCTVCGATCTHDWNAFFEDETTHKYICLSCKAENGTGAHVWNWYSAVDEKYHKAGCAECAYTVTVSHNFVMGTCSDCGASASATTCTHKWDDGVITKQPTTTESGIKTYTCTLCGLTKTAVIQAVDYDTYVNSLTYEQAFSIYEKIFDKYSTSLVTQIDYDKRVASLTATKAVELFDTLYNKFETAILKGSAVPVKFKKLYIENFVTVIFPDIAENGTASRYYNEYGGYYYAIMSITPSNSSDYTKGYNDAISSVVNENPVQGLFQGMWAGVVHFVTVVGGGIGIGGITMFSVLTTVFILALAYFLFKLIRK